MSLAEKIKLGWGYTVGAEPPNVVLQATGKDGVLSIAHWPNANPPTIAEIEAIELPPPSIRKLAPFDFQARFTDTELVAIQTSVDPLIIRGRTMLQTITTFVDLDDPQTQSLIGYMALRGLIASERVQEILA